MKSLRSTGSAQARARRREVLGRALEELAVGQHRQARRAAALRSSARSRPGSKCSRSTPLLGLAFLISAITAASPGIDLAPQRADEVARAALLRRAPAASASRDRALFAAATSSRLTATMRSRMSLIALAACLREGDELVELAPGGAARDRAGARARRRPRCVVATPADVERGAGVEHDDVARRPRLVVEHRQHHLLRLVRRRAPGSRGGRRASQAEVLGMDLVLADLAVLQLADHRRGAERDLVHAVQAVDRPARARRRGAAARAPGCRRGRGGTRPSAGSARRPGW